MSMPWRDYYDDLNLHLGATPAQIKTAFKAFALQTHPDKTGESDSTAFRCVKEAYDKLSDQELRLAYNKTYWFFKLKTEPPGTDPPGTENVSRTREYEDEEARRRSHSPPPIKPKQGYSEPGYMYFLGKPYTQWQIRMAAWRKRHPEADEK
jgi:curved DNA-binding protein CbpA